MLLGYQSQGDLPVGSAYEAAMPVNFGGASIEMQGPQEDQLERSHRQHPLQSDQLLMGTQRKN